MGQNLEERVIKLEILLERISENELPHIQEAVDKNNEKSDKILWWIIGGFMTVFAAVIIHGILTYFQIK